MAKTYIDLFIKFLFPQFEEKKTHFIGMCKAIKLLTFMNSTGWSFLIIDIHFHQWKKLSVIYLLYIAYITVHAPEHIPSAPTKYRVSIHLYM